MRQICRWKEKRCSTRMCSTRKQYGRVADFSAVPKKLHTRSHRLCRMHFNFVSFVRFFLGGAPCRKMDCVALTSLLEHDTFDTILHHLDDDKATVCLLTATKCLLQTRGRDWMRETLFDMEMLLRGHHRVARRLLRELAGLRCAYNEWMLRLTTESFSEEEVHTALSCLWLEGCQFHLQGGSQMMLLYLQCAVLVSRMRRIKGLLALALS